jgi:tripartite-type tricarboxylate transporter receptor subunit TctC
VTDFLARFLAQGLSPKLGRSVIVENRAGGGTLVGANSVAKSAPDGHQMLVMPLGVLFNSIISKTMPINFDRDLVPVSIIADQSLVLVVNSSLPVRNINELIAYAKQKPDELSFGTSGPGSLPDIAMELLKTMTDTRMVAIPYGGNTPAFMDVLSGRIHLMFLPLGSALQHINEGTVRAIGVSTLQRDSGAPAIPAIAEGLPGFAVTTWQALMITGGTPNAIVERLNADVHEITARPESLEKFKSLHLVRRPDATAAEDRAFILSEVHKWKPVLDRIELAKSAR